MRLHVATPWLMFCVLITASSSSGSAEDDVDPKVLANCKSICTGSRASEEVIFCQYCHSRNLVPTTAPSVLADPIRLPGNTSLAWLYGILSVAVIALAGFVSVILVPRLPERILNTVLQFLIALGVGTLTGDALLHLLPHSFLGHGHSHTGGGHGHGHSHGGHGHSHSKPADDEDEHTAMIWKGALALTVLIFFFFAERLMNIIRDRRVYANRSKVNKDESTDSRQAHRCIHDDGTPSVEANTPLKSPEDTEASVPFSSRHLETHHGHSHIRFLPGSSAKGRISSLAWLLVAGDSLHKFADGLVIGSGFAYSITDGLTTSIAVLFHEVPHELGDFAILIKTGMTVKQAIFCNMISSSLSLVGVLVGLGVGSSEEVNHWIFAGTAGMFLYIALVDIVPELTSGFGEAQSPFGRLALQLAGLLVGFGVMLLIALYEHDISYMLER